MVDSSSESTEEESYEEFDSDEPDTPTLSTMMTPQKPTELKIRLPVDFNGDRTKTKEFVLDCKMYLNINETTYNTNTKKILFVLSYMRGGTAGPWKENLAQQKRKFRLR